MIDAVWLEMLRRFPPEMQSTITVVTITGTELVIQQIFKMERDFMVMRARTAGTGDLGRIIMIPYAQLDFMTLPGALSEAEVMKIFEEPMPEFERAPVAYLPTAAYQPAPAPRPQPSATPKPPHPATPVAAALAAEETFEFASGEATSADVKSQPKAEPAKQPAAESAPAKPGQISKTVLLARLRERLAEKAR